MKRLVYLIICLLSFCPWSMADSHTFYFKMNSVGQLDSYVQTAKGFTVTIDRFVVNEGYISCGITLVMPESYDSKDIIPFRLHASGTTHRTTDNDNPLWNLKLQPTLNPKWCFFEIIDEHTISFLDTFSKKLLKDENYYVNTLKYSFIEHNHVVDIFIQNAFAEGIITNVNNIRENVETNGQVVYYNVYGQMSDKPFNGFNIIKYSNGDIEKKMFK